MEILALAAIAMFIGLIYIGDKLKKNQDDISLLRDEFAELREQVG